MTKNELDDINFFYKRSMYPQYKTANFFNAETGEVIFIVYDPAVSAFITLKDLVTFDKKALKGIVTWLKTRSIDLYKQFLEMWMLREEQGWYSMRQILPPTNVDADIVGLDKFIKAHEIILEDGSITTGFFYIFKVPITNLLNFEKNDKYPMYVWLENPFESYHFVSMGDLKKAQLDVKYWR